MSSSPIIAVVNKGVIDIFEVGTLKIKVNIDPVTSSSMAPVPTSSSSASAAKMRLLEF